MNRQEKSLDRFFKFFLNNDFVTGFILLFSAMIALLWANSPFQNLYSVLWYHPFTVSAAGFTVKQNLHFVVNDIMMTGFFLLAAFEIRHEWLHGALQNRKQALLPFFAAFGGVFAPFLIYFLFNSHSSVLHGWAIPIATDIAFAVGVLALLGNSIPNIIRLLLLSIAIIDDIIAVLVIALFYSSAIDLSGFILVVIAAIAIMLLQQFQIRSLWIFIVPAVFLWFGFFIMGVHPSLAGVILGFFAPIGSVERYLRFFVSFMIMPLFAFANAGMELGGLDFSVPDSVRLFLAIMLAMIIGKPLGVLLASFVVVRLGLCCLPVGMSWSGMILIGLLAGIGFTMSIFIALLAFESHDYLRIAKLAVLLGSCCSILLGFSYGVFYKKHFRFGKPSK